MNNDYTIEDYVRDNPKNAHIKLYTQLLLTADKKVFELIKDDDVLNFDLGDIRYSIKLGELKQKCREEGKNFESNDTTSDI